MDKEKRQKLTQIVDGPSPVTKAENQYKNVVRERSDRIIKNISCNDAVLTPKTKTELDLMTEAHSMKPTDIVFDHPVDDRDNVRHIYRTKEVAEDAIKQQEPTIVSPTDSKKA